MRFLHGSGAGRFAKRHFLCTLLYGFMFIFGTAFMSSAVPSARAAQPQPWQFGFQPPATELTDKVMLFHHAMLYVAIGIALLVLGLLIYAMLRFSAGKNPTPSQTTHNTVLEIVWTAIPILILVAIAIPSFRLLYAQKIIPEVDMTIKVTSYQWYWEYEYPDHGDILFDALMLSDDEREVGQPRLLATDNAMVVPVDTTVQLIITSADVLHSWTVPAFGIKVDSVPGRLNTTWFRASKTGTFYGQCSELCGSNHSFMPIMVRVVEKEEFANWVEWAKIEFAMQEDGIRRDSDIAHDSGIAETEMAESDIRENDINDIKESGTIHIAALAR